MPAILILVALFEAGRATSVRSAGTYNINVTNA